MSRKQDAAADTKVSPHAGAGLYFGRSWKTMGGFLVKLILMGLINALGLYVIITAWGLKSYVIMGVAAALLLLADIIYFSKRTVPLKYLYPGLVFLAVFQVFVFVYTGYIAFTNYGFGHMGNQEQAVNAAMIQAERRVEGSPTYPLTVIRDGDQVGFAIAKDGAVFMGTEDEPLHEVAGTLDGDKVSQVEGWESVPVAKLLTDTALQNEVVDMRVGVSDDPEEGSLRTRDGTNAITTQTSMVWNPETQTLSDTATGVDYVATSDGTFRSEDGQTLNTGWVVPVGFKNFTKAFTTTSLGTPLLEVTLWTFAFAILTVLTSFGLGLLFAIIYNDSRIKGRRILRTLFILPYAFPAFMSALLWRGMFNSEFGVINDLFFFGANINWLGDPWLARFAILFVNLWLSFPYWFLVSTGALQAIPEDVIEAATIDGAGPIRRFQSVVLPLLLVSTAPLAIASFAFNFNNFNIIYMMTTGGPAIPGAPYTLGRTDLLISAIYKISGVSAGQADYGFAAALSILVFIVIGVISAISFRQTRRLEEYA